jgi:hypothetical protein
MNATTAALGCFFCFYDGDVGVNVCGSLCNDCSFGRCIRFCDGDVGVNVCGSLCHDMTYILKCDYCTN